MKVWEHSVGEIPHKVTVYERVAKKRVLYLRWRADGNWRHRSLKKKLRTHGGRIIHDVKRRAVAAANAHHETIIREGLTPEARQKRLTIDEALPLVTHRETGMYPVDTPHRREVLRAMKVAELVLGADTPWEAVRHAQLRKLWRWRITALAAKGHDGARGAEVTVARFLAVAQWLRDEEQIPRYACIPTRHWKRELKDDWRRQRGADTNPEPKRPRHTLEEMRSILEVADQVDPRFSLLIDLGAELRLGQVARSWRSDLDLEAGTLTVRSVGRKKGEVVKLTDGQAIAVYAALTGYLADLEQSGADYRLFPSGQLPGGRSGNPHATDRHRHAKPIGRRRILEWFRQAEKLAAVEHVPGRGAYGLRRVAVDAAKKLGISREGLKAHGGWTDTQMPDRIYADQEADHAREEAKAIRARIRGELQEEKTQ